MTTIPNRIMPPCLPCVCNAFRSALSLDTSDEGPMEGFRVRCCQCQRAGLWPPRGRVWNNVVSSLRSRLEFGHGSHDVG